MSTRTTLGLVVILCLVLAACSSGGAGSPAASEPPAAATPPTEASPAAAGAVTIVDFGFEPAALSVAVGSTVTWTNDGSAPHTVKWSDGTSESPNLGSGATYERTFDAAGEYPYVCGIHGSMKGTITVTE